MALISINNLTFAYDGAADNVFENVSLQIDTSWKLGLVGRNGRGKTTLLRLLMGQLEYGGKIASNIKFEYFPYEIENLNISAIDIASTIYPEIQEWQLERELNLLSFDTKRLYQTYSHLSYGEKTKIMLASLFCKPNAFLLIDEPTNHLDSAARQILAEYLSRKSGFILVSHDRKVLDECVDHIISINRADIEIIAGNFSVWEQNKEYKDAFELAENEKLKKVLLACSLCEQAHLYIWDEPLNFIDVLSHSQIEDLILANKPTILFVEHDRSFTKRIATKEILFS
jgi:lincosamide and streptogramin A transport system ATP-binding/permease protein